MMKEIRNVGFVGSESISRRTALAGIGLGAIELIGQRIFGSAASSVGLSVDSSTFRPIGGFLDKDTLVLPSGQSILVAQYGNPLLAPAIFHAASLSQLDPDIVDLAALSKYLPTKASSGKEHLQGLRAYSFFLKEGNGYKHIDLSQQLESPPSVQVNSKGGIEIKVGENTLVRFSDGYYINALYHADKGRIDPNAVIAICETGNPPSRANPVIVSELGAPLLVSADSLDSWRGTEIIHGLALNRSPSLELLTGETFIAVGAYMWRYRYALGATGNNVLEADCKPHGGKGSEQWDQMDANVLYQLVHEGNNTVIRPEPHREKTINISHLRSGSSELIATGVVIHDIANGQVTTERTSLSAARARGEEMYVNGNELTVVRKDKRHDTYQIIEARKKTGFENGTYDIYAVKKSSALPFERAVFTSIGSYDFIEAHKDTQRLIAAS